MSLMPITPSFFPRSMFDMDLWGRPSNLGVGPSTWDLFDPFDELDRMMSRNLMWLNEPELSKELIPIGPEGLNIFFSSNNQIRT